MALRQWLVRFQNKTFVVNVNDADVHVLAEISALTGWARERLVLVSQNHPFMSVRLVSSLKGGKGGFGTLLKGQGKQSGARVTMDFGACRDLQGRRLRHVNDEIKLRKWRELQEKKKRGEEVDDVKEGLDTQSGIFNWHLLTPAWGEVSKKAISKQNRQLKREFSHIKSEAEKKEDERRAKQAAHEHVVAAYVAETQAVSESLGVSAAIQQGLDAKRKRSETAGVDDTHQQEPNLLVTLSGDFALEEEEASGGWTIQAKQEFSTLALILASTPSSGEESLYYECKFETTGICQIGWAFLGEFKPNTATGDGVGEGSGSYAIDLGRGLKFHNGEQNEYGSRQTLNSGDILGCCYNFPAQTLSYSMNGKDLGVAFTLSPNSSKKFLVPAISCNQTEIVQLHLGPDQMKYLPEDAIPIYNLMKSSKDDESSAKPVGTDDADDAKKSAAVKNDSSMPPPPPSKRQKSDNPPAKPSPIPFVLEKFESVEELMEFGLEGLKSALLAMQCKCGGTLEERAKRLLSLKGVERKDYPLKVRGKIFDEKL